MKPERRTNGPDDGPAGATRASRHDRKRERIVKAATELFFDRGFASTTVDALAVRLGVTKPYIYYYFRDKNALFDSVCLIHSKANLSSVRAGAAGKRTPLARLRGALRELALSNLRRFKGGSLYYREGAALSPATRANIRRMAQGFYDDLRGILRDCMESGDIEPGDIKLKALAIGSIVGFLYTWYSPDGRLGPEKLAEQLTSIMLSIAGVNSLPRSRAVRRRTAG